MRDFSDFVEWFAMGLAILVLLASIGLYVYMMYYLVINDNWLRVAVIACMTFCIWCGVKNMDWPFDDLL